MTTPFNQGKQTPAQRRARTRATEVRTEAGIKWAEANAGQWNKTWETQFTACDECQAMNGETVPVDQNFSNGEPGPPMHPNCLCGISMSQKNQPRPSIIRPDNGS